jgi:cytosine/adenosine deaminase-related metal-dependent hydrolase
VTPEELSAILPLAEAGPVHIHAAEQIKEVEDSIAWSGRRPVEWLLEHAPIDQRWCLIHATHMTKPETAALASSGAVAGLCPVTEASLGDGIFPAREFVGAGGRFGIGTDSNVLVGAQALAQPTVGLKVGARADIVALDATHPSLAGRHGDAVLDGWIFAAGADAVNCVWASGDKVVEGGYHRLRRKAREAFNAAVRRLAA